jgi:hypothetical protein
MPKMANRPMGPLEAAAQGFVGGSAEKLARAHMEMGYEEHAKAVGLVGSPDDPGVGNLGEQLVMAQELEKHLASVCRDLEKRLEPFLMPPEPHEETAKTPEPPMSPMAALIRAHNRALQSCIEHLRVVSARVER